MERATNLMLTAALWAFALAGCGGYGERTPRAAGASTELDPRDFRSGPLQTGAIAVDPTTETTFVISAQREEGEGWVRRSALLAVHPDDGRVQVVRSLGAEFNHSLHFVEDGLILQSSQSLTLYDPQSLQERRVYLHGSTLETAVVSPRRRLLAMRDGGEVRVRTSDLSGGARLVFRQPVRAMAWTHQTDRIVGFSYSPWMLSGARSTHVEVIEATAPEGQEPRRVLDVTIPATGLRYGSFLDFEGNLVVSPDDRYAVLTLRHFTSPEDADGQLRLYFVDLQTGVVTTTEGRGPVGFTADGTIAIGFALGDPGTTAPTQLLVIDVATMRHDRFPLPLYGAPSFFTTRNGHRVVVGGIDDNARVQLFDLTRRQMIGLDGPSVGLGSFVVRERDDSLYALHATFDDGDALHRISLETRRVERIGLGWEAANLNLLPRRDLLVFDVPGRNRLRYWSPATRQVVREVPLPAP